MPGLVRLSAFSVLEVATSKAHHAAGVTPRLRFSFHCLTDTSAIVQPDLNNKSHKNTTSSPKMIHSAVLIMKKVWYSALNPSSAHQLIDAQDVEPPRNLMTCSSHKLLSQSLNACILGILYFVYLSHRLLQCWRFLEFPSIFWHFWH